MDRKISKCGTCEGSGCIDLENLAEKPAIEILKLWYGDYFLRLIAEGKQSTECAGCKGNGEIEVYVSNCEIDLPF